MYLMDLYHQVPCVGGGGGRGGECLGEREEVRGRKVETEREQGRLEEGSSPQ